MTNSRPRELDSDERGAFVYQVLQRVRPLESPHPASPLASSSSSSSSSGFHRGDLISVDLVRRGRLDQRHNEVAYLRLSDGSGWIPDSMSFPSSGHGTSSAMALVKPVEVEEGLWTMYVDNCPRGQSLRHHPLDSPDTIVRLGGGGGAGANRTTSFRHPLLGCSSRDVEDGHGPHDGAVDHINSDDDEDDDDGLPVFYETMVKVHCDRKVVSPTTYVAYYRVQAVNKWLMDRRVTRNPDAAALVSNTAPAVLFTQMLLDAAYVRTGIFCFQAIENLLVRSRDTVEDSAGTPYKVKKGRLVAVDVIKDSFEPHNGPYLRLSDGSGWLFLQKNGVPMMEQVPVQPGAWELRVVAPAGMSLQRHPVEASTDPAVQKRATYPDPSFPKGSLVQASYRVRVLNPNHDSSFHEVHAVDEPHSFLYYRVHGTNGWLADRQPSGRRALQVLTEDVDTMASLRDNGRNDVGWTPEFVRGVASTVSGLKEVAFTPSSCNPVLVFAMASSRHGGGECTTNNNNSNGDGIRRVVYCATRTVGILFDGAPTAAEDRNDQAEAETGDDDDDKDSVVVVEPVAPARWYRNCTPKDLWDHLRKDAIEIMMEPLEGDSDDENDDKSSKRLAAERAIESDEASNRDELALRKQLLTLDSKMEAAEAKRREIVHKLRGYDEARLQEAARMRFLMDEHRAAYGETLAEPTSEPPSSLKDSKQPEPREGGGYEGEHEDEHPDAVELTSSASTTSSESTTESIEPGKKKRHHGSHSKCRSADAASPLPPALSTSPRSRRVQGAASVDRVSWHDQQRQGSKGTSRQGAGPNATTEPPPIRRANSQERESFRNRIEELLHMRSAETAATSGGGGGGASTLLSILSPEADESLDEDSNTLVSDSGQSYDSESEDLSAEYDSY